MSSYVGFGDVKYVNETEEFNQLIEEEDFSIPCECRWHADGTHTPETIKDQPAKWAVRTKAKPCGHGGGVKLWCDPCLQAVLNAPAFRFHCHVCGHAWIGKSRHMVESYEPIARTP